MNKNKLFEGKKMHDLAKELWPISRSLTGEGNRKTLKILKKVCKNLKIFEINSDTKVFDWKIPNEWVARKAWIKDSKGKKILDFTKNNLHLMGYSIPVHKKINFKELKKKFIL